MSIPAMNAAVYVIALAVIMANIILHAPFMIATRYAFPIVPLYIILFALNLEYIVMRKEPA